jgi:hypothetical protein
MVSARQPAAVLAAHSAFACATLFFCGTFGSTAHAQSSVRFRPGDYVASPNGTVTLPIEVASDADPVTGFSFGVTHRGPITVERVERSARFNAILGATPSADFLVVDTTPAGGAGFIVAAILPPGTGAPVIPAGVTHVYDATYRAAADATGTATVTFTDSLSAQAGAPTVDLVVDFGNGTPRTFVATSEEVTFVQGFLRGDSDLSGTRSGDFSRALAVTDAVIILQHLFSGAAAPPCRDAADADDTGDLRLTDALVILNFLFLDGIPPAPPFPTPGIDPTPDTLDCAGLGL